MTTSMQRTCFLITLFFGLCLSGRAQTPYEMLWEVRHPSQARPSYLFGTMHISDSRVFDLPDSVILAIQNTDGMAFELDFDSTSYYTFEYLMRDGDYSLDDLDKLASRLSPPSYENIVDRIFERLNSPDEEEEEEAPAPDPEDENSVLFLDAFLYRVGRDLGKERTGLEQVEDQFKLLYGADGEASVLSKAKSSIRSGDLTKAYLAGNLSKIEKWLEEGKMFDPTSRKLLLDDRNVNMARGADSLIRRRPTFIAVGAGHLPGKAGVITLLRQRGYSVRPVRATQKTGLARAAKARTYTPKWQTFRNEAAGYALKVPCRPYRATFTDLPVPMYMGMDFPGGWVYYFFAFPFDMMGAGVDKDEVRERMVSAMINSMDSESQVHPVQSGDFKGEEAIIKFNDQSLRIRGVSDDKMVFVIFAGVDESIVNSPMLDTMFNSLTSFPALQLTQRQWGTRVDSLGGFSMPMPLEVNRTVKSASSDDLDPSYYEVHFQATDEQTKEEFALNYALVESQVLEENDPLAVISDSLSSHFPHANLLGQSEISVDGYRGLEYRLDLDGIHTAVYRWVQRGDRLYMYGGTYTDEAASKARIISALDGFRFLPMRHSPLRHDLRTATFNAKFPAPARAYHNEELETDFWSSYGADSTQSWSAVDPRSGTYYFLSKVDFPAWTALDSLTELFAAFNEPREDRKDTYSRAITVPGALAAWERLSPTLDQRTNLYMRLLMHGHSVYCLFSVIEGQDEAPARAFADGIQLLPVPAFDWTSSKLPLLLTALQSGDEEQSYRASTALSFHRLDASNRRKLFDFLGQLAKKGDVPDYTYTLIDALTYTPTAGDDAAFEDLIQRFGAEPDVQTYLIGALFYQDTLDLPQKGLALLKRLQPQPSDPYSLEDMVLRIESLLMNSKDPIPLYDQLAFMLDVPAYQAEYLYLTEAMGGIGELEARHTGIYRARFQELAEAWIAKPNYDENVGGLSYNYDYLISALYLADPDARSYALLERIMDMGDPRVEEYAVLLLLDADHPLPKSRLIHLLEQPGYSETLLYWLWTHDQQKRIPKKYWKRDHLAKAILQDRLLYVGGNGPSTIELLEKVPLFWQNKDQLLYVYRVGYADREDWEIAFSGPFPEDNKYEDFVFSLSGTDFKTWSPQRQQDLIDEWIEQAGSDESEWED